MSDLEGALNQIEEALERGEMISTTPGNADVFRQALAKCRAIRKEVPEGDLRECWKSHSCLALELPEEVYAAHTEIMQPAYNAAALLHKISKVKP